MPEVPSELVTFAQLSLAPTMPVVYVCAAGFEDRAVRGAELIRKAGLNITGSVVLRFVQNQRPENEASYHRIVAALRHRLSDEHIVTGDVDSPTLAAHACGKFKPACVVIDVSGMPHGTMLQFLRAFSQLGVRLLVLYTEAKSYYPKKVDAGKYLKHSDDEAAFIEACMQESSDVMFGGLASVGVLEGFEGRLVPTAPTAIILFPTFKRLRTSSVLAELEVHRKIVIIGRPVRHDLSWRARALRVINLDLMDEDTDVVTEVSTLSPVECFDVLERLMQDEVLSGTWNILVCPHGSKMQSVAVWAFCERHKDFRVVISHPKEFFPKKYSEGYGETFVFDIAKAWPSAQALID